MNDCMYVAHDVIRRENWQKLECNTYHASTVTYITAAVSVVNMTGQNIVKCVPFQGLIPYAKKLS